MPAKHDDRRSLRAARDWWRERDSSKSPLEFLPPTALIALIGLVWWVVDGATGGILEHIGGVATGAFVGAMIASMFFIVGSDDADGNERFPPGILIAACIGALCAPWLVDVSDPRPTVPYDVAALIALACLLLVCAHTIVRALR